MQKEYLRVDRQIDLLERRGMTCNDNTAKALAREGYYAIINGYGKPFLDVHATREAGDDRYLPGTTFAHVHALFLFDRELRMITFGELTRLEGRLRALAAASFLEEHPEPDAYLDEQSYSTARHYLLGEQVYERNLRHTISTLSRYAHDHEHDERGRDDARLAHYRAHYESVPLWVVFSDFSYGNLYHFVALMRRDEQTDMCRRLAAVLSDDGTRGEMSRQTLVGDMGLQVDVRNICAHGERLYDMPDGERAGRGYARFARMLGRYLDDDELRGYDARVASLLSQHMGVSPVLDRVLERVELRDVLAQRA